MFKAEDDLTQEMGVSVDGEDEVVEVSSETVPFIGCLEMKVGG